MGTVSEYQRYFSVTGDMIKECKETLSHGFNSEQIETMARDINQRVEGLQARMGYVEQQRNDIKNEQKKSCWRSHIPHCSPITRKFTLLNFGSLVFIIGGAIVTMTHEDLITRVVGGTCIIGGAIFDKISQIYIMEKTIQAEKANKALHLAELTNLSDQLEDSRKLRHALTQLNKVVTAEKNEHKVRQASAAICTHTLALISFANHYKNQNFEEITQLIYKIIQPFLKKTIEEAPIRELILDCLQNNLIPGHNKDLEDKLEVNQPFEDKQKLEEKIQAIIRSEFQFSSIEEIDQQIRTCVTSFKNLNENDKNDDLLWKMLYKILQDLPEDHPIHQEFKSLDPNADQNMDSSAEHSFAYNYMMPSPDIHSRVSATSNDGEVEIEINPQWGEVEQATSIEMINLNKSGHLKLQQSVNFNISQSGDLSHYDEKQVQSLSQLLSKQWGLSHQDSLTFIGSLSDNEKHFPGNNTYRSIASHSDLSSVT